MWRRFETIFWQIVFIGYVTFGRSFAYVGFPPLFIGETFIGSYIVGNRRRWVMRFFHDIFQLKLIPTSIFLMLSWGIFECLRSYWSGQYQLMDIIKSFAFNYYPLVIPIGMAIGQDVTMARFLRFFKALSWTMAIYSVLYCVLAGEGWLIPWVSNNVAVFNSPLMAPLIAVGMLSLWPYLNGWKPRIWLMLLSMSTIFYNPGRGTILALVIGLCCVSLVSVKRATIIFGCMFGVFVVMSAIGPYLPGAGGRAGSMDPIFVVSRVVSTVSEKAGADMLTWAGYHEDAAEAGIAKETAQWRKDFWNNCLRSLNSTELVILGHGHGADIGEFVPSGGEEIRTPHNIVVFSMFHTGVIGVATLALLIASLFLGAVMIQDPNIRALALAMILMNCMQSMVGDLFETPFGAIPCYLLVGILLKMPPWPPALMARRRGFEPAMYQQPMVIQAPNQPAYTYR